MRTNGYVVIKKHNRTVVCDSVGPIESRGHCNSPPPPPPYLVLSAKSCSHILMTTLPFIPLLCYLKPISFTDEYDTSRVRICKPFMEPGFDSASLCSLTGRYDKYCRVLVPGCQDGNQFLGFLKGLQIRAQLRAALESNQRKYLDGCYEYYTVLQKAWRATVLQLNQPGKCGDQPASERNVISMLRHQFPAKKMCCYQRGNGA